MRKIILILFGTCYLAAAVHGDEFLYNGVTAHRGNSGEFPENTLPAFESGVEVGADWLELDRIYTDYPRQLLQIMQQTRHTSGKDSDHE